MYWNFILNAPVCRHLTLSIVLYHGPRWPFSKLRSRSLAYVCVSASSVIQMCCWAAKRRTHYDHWCKRLNGLPDSGFLCSVAFNSCYSWLSRLCLTLFGITDLTSPPTIRKFLYVSAIWTVSRSLTWNTIDI